MNKRFVAAGIFLLFFSFLTVLAAYNIHQFFSRQMMFSLSLLVCIQGLLAVPEIRTWAFLLELLVLLGLFWLIFGSAGHIKPVSKVIHVCPGIETPVPEGQGQYGTARWMSAGEINEAFTAIHIDSLSPGLRELKAAGRDDMEGGL